MMNQQLIVAVFASLVATAAPVDASELTYQFFPRELQDSGSIHVPLEGTTKNQTSFPTECSRTTRKSDVELVCTIWQASPPGGTAIFPDALEPSIRTLISQLDQKQGGVNMDMDVDEDIELNAVADDRLMDGQELMSVPLSALI